MCVCLDSIQTCFNITADSGVLNRGHLADAACELRRAEG